MLDATSASTYCSLVASTSKCGWAKCRQDWNTIESYNHPTTCGSRALKKDPIWFGTPKMDILFIESLSATTSQLELVGIHETYACVIWLLIKHMYWIGVWLGDDQEQTPSRHMLKEIGLRFQIVLTTPHSIVDTIGRPMCSVKKSTNM